MSHGCGSLSLQALLWGVLIVLATGCTAEPFQVALHVREDAGVAREAEPVASGIPLPQGAVFDPADVRVYDTGGKPIPCQAHQLGLSWPDGSLRWVLLQFQASLEAGGDAVYALRSEPGQAALLPAEAVAVRDAGDMVEVTTGPLRFTVSRSDFHLPNTLALRTAAGDTPVFVPVLAEARLDLRADREYMSREDFAATGKDPKDLATYGIADTGEIKWGKLQQGPDGTGTDYSGMLAGPVTITVEERGPLRAVLRVERAAEKTEGDVGFVVRLYAYAGKPYLRLEYTLESYEQFLLVPAEGYQRAICNSKHIREFTYRLKPAGALTDLSFGTATTPAAPPPAGSPALRQFEPQSFAVRDAAGADLAQCDHAPGWMSATVGEHTLSLATRWFWESAPKGLSYDSASGELALELRPQDAPGSGYPLAAGRV